MQADDESRQQGHGNNTENEDSKNKSSDVVEDIAPSSTTPKAVQEMIAIGTSKHMSINNTSPYFVNRIDFLS